MPINPNLPAVIEWEAYEYIHPERSVDWFWGVGLAGVVIGIIAIFIGNFLMAVLVIVGGAAVLLGALRHPDLEYYALTPRGVVEGTTLYPYAELDVFWIAEIDPPKLLIRSRRTLAPLITLPLPETVNTQVIHDYLYQYLDDEPLHESALQKIMERLGF